MIAEHFFDSREALLNALQTNISTQLLQALEARPRASLLVSGGSSPIPLYQRLSQTDLPWSEIDIALVDERWVAESDSASNARMIRQTLLQGRAANARFTGMYSGDASAREALPSVEALYRALPRPFDITLLGMGEDGHTASLFPHAEGLEQALADDGEALCTAIHALPSKVSGEQLERMTLTLNALLESRQILLLLQGDSKLDCYRQALACAQDPAAMPVRAVLHQRKVPVSVYWAP